MILDSTCSTKRIWPEFADVRMDIKPEVKPDIAADAKHLPFRERVFDEIYCDPPHLFGPGHFVGLESEHRMARFGFWKDREEWLIFRLKTDFEFHRCLKQEGVLHYKITDAPSPDVTKMRDLYYMQHFKIMEDKCVRSAQKKVAGVISQSNCHYVEMKPI